MIRCHLNNGTLSLRLDGTLVTGDASEALHLMPRADKVVLFIDSIGGCSFEMSGLVSALLLHVDTAAFILGNAFSAAAVIARACRQTTIHPAGQVMVHRSRMSVLGERADFERAITKLESLDTVPSLVFGFRGMSSKEIHRLEAEGDHYHSPLAALRAGLVDRISDKIPDWPLPEWADRVPDAPAGPRERVVIGILEALGQVEVSNRHAFSRRLASWFDRYVHEPSTASERPYGPPATPK